MRHFASLAKMCHATPRTSRALVTVSYDPVRSRRSVSFATQVVPAILYAAAIFYGGLIRMRELPEVGVVPTDKLLHASRLRRVVVVCSCARFAFPFPGCRCRRSSWPARSEPRWWARYWRFAKHSCPIARLMCGTGWAIRWARRWSSERGLRGRASFLGALMAEAAFHIPRLIVFSDASRAERSLLLARFAELGQRALAGSVLFCLRDYELSARARWELARELALLSASSEQSFGVADRADLARALDCRAFHLPERGLRATDARRYLGPRVFLSQACHDPWQPERRAGARRAPAVSHLRRTQRAPGARVSPRWSAQARAQFWDVRRCLPWARSTPVTPRLALRRAPRAWP